MNFPDPDPDPDCPKKALDQSQNIAAGSGVVGAGEADLELRKNLVGQFGSRIQISTDNHHEQSMVIPYFPPHPNGEVISKWPRCSGTHMERQTQRGVRQIERRWLANAFFIERLPARAISWRWLPTRKNTKKMRMYRPWGYLNIRTVSHTIVILGNYDSSLLFLQLSARQFGRLLHRILQRCGSLFEVRIRHLQIMFLCDSLRVADPSTNNVDRERLRQFRFSRAA